MKPIKTFMISASLASAILLGAQQGQAELLGDAKGTVNGTVSGTVNSTVGGAVRTGPLGAATDTRIRAGADANAGTGASVTTTTTTETRAGEGGSTTTRVREKTAVESGTRVFNLMEFDLNGDKILSTPEVGEKLFAMYDTDGNMVIDNKEYERKSVVTVVPVARDVTISTDIDGDGKAIAAAQSSETFLRHTQLARFDAGKDGLSPHEFMSRSFLQADVNGDKTIDMKEWRASYDAGVAAEVEQKARFNK